MADACVFLLENRDFSDVLEPRTCSGQSLEELPGSQKPKEVRNTHINIGTGVDISIKELAELIQKIIGFEGELKFNINKPDGTMVKLTDPSKLHSLGWKHKVELEDGIKTMYEWYLNSK
jgi:GDP-L-fucose synthase